MLFILYKKNVALFKPKIEIDCLNLTKNEKAALFRLKI